MYRYECHICHGLCDAGELENGVCHECRETIAHAEEERQLRIRAELNRTIHDKLSVQKDGQLKMI